MPREVRGREDCFAARKGLSMSLALEDFIKQLEDSGIVDGATLREVVSPGGPATLQDVARELVKKRKLTRFQAEEAARGRAERLVLGNYLLLERIGAGGMGQVFKARHRRMDREVAIKVLSPDLVRRPGAIARFEREVRAAAKISHPNIITAFDADHAGGLHFLVMEYVQGVDLSALVKKQGPLSVSKTLDVALQAAKGLEAAHAAGVVHRDIKPGNLLLDTKGMVKVLDLGLARVGGVGESDGSSDLTNTGSVMGTVDYMAPEQAIDTKHADGRADIYALGCTMHWLLVGKAPYGGETMMAKLLAHREAPIPSLQSERADVPDGVEALFRRMVAKLPEDRYPTISDLIADLKRLRAGQPPAETTMQLSTGPADDAFPSLPDLASLAAQSPSRRRGLLASLDAAGRRVVWSIVAAGAIGMAVLAAIIVSMQTRDGTVVVEVDQPGAEVRVLDGDGQMEIVTEGGAGTVTIAVDPGKHRLVVAKDGFEAYAEEFVLTSGGRREIAAKLVPLKDRKTDPKPLPASPGSAPGAAASEPLPASLDAVAERRAAEWAQQHGAGLEIATAGGRVSVAAGAALPDEAFAVVAIRRPQRIDWARETLDVLPDLAGLELLDLFDTQVTPAALRSIARCRSLRDLSLQRCGIDDADVATLAPLPALAKLRLTDESVTDAVIPVIAKHVGLVALHVGNTALRCARLGELEACPDLADLQIGGCWLDPGWADGVARLTSLRSLELSFTTAGDDDLAALRRLARLEYLSLRGTSVGDGVVDSLLAMPALRICEAELTAITDSGMRRLVEGLNGRATVNPSLQYPDRTTLPDRVAAAIATGTWTKVDFSQVTPSVGADPMATGGDPAFAPRLRDSDVPPGVRAGRPFVVRRNRWCTLPSPTAADIVLRVRFRIIREPTGPRSASFRVRESGEGGVGVVIDDTGAVSPGIFRWRETPAFTPGARLWRHGPLPDGPLTATLAVVGDKAHVWFNGRYFRFTIDDRLRRGGIGFGWLDDASNMVVEEADYQILD